MGEERISFRPVPGLEAIQALSASESRRPWSMVHDTFTPTLVSAGTGRWKCSGAGGEIRPAQVLLISPGDVHKTLRIEEPGGSFCAFFVPPEYVRTLVRPDAGGPDCLRFEAIATDDPLTVAAMARLARAVARIGSDPLTTSELAAITLRTLFTRNAAGVSCDIRPSADEVAEAVAVIREAFKRDPCTPGLTAESLRATVGAKSTTGLIHGFTRQMAVPPHQYLVRLRVQLARRLIGRGPNVEEGMRSLTDVAIASGFYDLSHMGRVFRRALGVAPSVYARQIRIAWPGVAAPRLDRPDSAITRSRASSP